MKPSPIDKLSSRARRKGTDMDIDRLLYKTKTIVRPFFHYSVGASRAVPALQDRAFLDKGD
ncbi:MAG: hypothetical protein WKF90_17420 [Pyrinomonadaceae bacterium]